MIPYLAPGASFPDAERALAEPDGLLCAGNDLAPATIVRAYRQGIFPWFAEGQPILWWSPDPRMVLLPENFTVSKSLAKTIRQGRFEIRIDTAFAEVIAGCAAPRHADAAGSGGTWIVPDMQAAYLRLHKLGVAHSVESWRDGELAGGLYGLALGRVFFGESMFARVSDASKVALAALVEKLKRDGFELIDCQQVTAHLARFGAAPIARGDFLRRLRGAIPTVGHESDWRR